MKKILIVDDHADIRKLIRMTLEFENFEVFEAQDGEAALQMAQSVRPELVLLDVMMPGALDGLEVCRRLRALPELGHVPVIVLSARGQSSDREAGLRAGASAYLVKPFSPLHLIDTIAAMWEVA